jgi:CRP-like cAMP-binding protein
VIPQPIDQVPLFLRLSDDERELISSRLRHLEFNTNDVIFAANKPAEMLGVIVQGWIKLESESPQGRIALANLGAGSVIGEVDLMLNRAYSTTARAASATSIHALYRQDLQDLILECPTIGLKFSYGLGTRVAYLDEYLVTQRLGATPLLSAIAEEEMRAIARKLQFRTFQRGETIFEAGSAGEAVYLVEEGSARLITPSRDGESFEELKDGEIFGQTALITGKPYLATALAVADLSVWYLTRADYQELIRNHPPIKLAFSRALAEGLSADDQAKAVEQLRALPLFADVEREALRDLTGCLVLRHFPAGDLIYAEGTPGDAMYFVESGEVRILSDASTEGELIERKHEGQSFGEMALLTGRTRAEAAKALDDSTVWVLYKSDYDELIVRHPTLSLALSRALSSKLGEWGGEYVEKHLHQIKLFAGLSQSEMKAVAEFVKPLRFRPGETICFAGQTAQYVYLVESGEVREIAGDLNGQTVVLNLLGADQSFGERAVFQSAAYSATMQAVGDVGCWTIAKVDFDRLIARYPALALNAARQIADDAERVTHRPNRIIAAPPVRSNGSGRLNMPQPPIRQPSTYASPPPPPRAPWARPSVATHAPVATQVAPVAQMAPAVGLRTTPGKPWERPSNSVMRPMPAATARPIAVGSSMAWVQAPGGVRPIRATQPDASITERLAAMSTSTKIKMAIVGFFAFWLLIVLPLILILTLLANSSSFLGIFSGNSTPSQQLPDNLQTNSPKVSGLIPGVAKLAVRERTATPTSLPPPPAPTSKPTAKSAAKKPLVTLKAAPKPQAPTASATPTSVAQAAAVRPPLPPRLWDKRLGDGGLPMLVGVGVTDANVQSGQTFWRLVKMQFQDAGAESGNDHTIYISIVDENAQRVDDATVMVSWDQSGAVEIQRLGLTDEKPKGDFCNCNYNWPMYGAGYRVKIDGPLPSDEAHGMIMPEHRHVNYLLIFQRVVMP